MFEAAHNSLSLAIQLCYYRGFNEFHASPWLTSPEELLAHMDTVNCLGGPTQIHKTLLHYLHSGSATTPVRGLVFIGDAMEEDRAALTELAGQCRLRNQPLFLFQEGRDAVVENCFRSMAQLSGGAYAQFDRHSAQTLRELLGAVARYASGGRRALQQSDREGDKLLLSQLPRQ